jgi:hypothetical protein
VAYQSSNNWWLNGPTDPRGWGCDSPGGCGGLSGFRGLGQSCDSVNFSAMTDAQLFNCGYTDSSGNIIALPTTAPTIAGIPQNYLMIGGVILAGFLLLGALKK